MNRTLQAVLGGLRRYFNRQPTVLSIAEAEAHLRPNGNVDVEPAGYPSLNADRSAFLNSDLVDAANGGVR